MEMHQVRYFLAVARVLNFTRAAEECHVAQPSLTRAIKQLEQELGGELFRRERNLTHLSELGHRMLPLMQQCYDSAVSAKSLASSLKTGAVAPLSLALSAAVNIALIIPFLTELIRVFPGTELKFLRGTGSEISEQLKKGEADVAIAGSLGETWERLDAWPLFTEPYALVVGKDHRLAKRPSVAAGELAKERIISRVHCEHSSEVASFLKGQDCKDVARHQVTADPDTLTLLEQNLGIAIMPASIAKFANVSVVPLAGLELNHTLSVYAVAGRQRSAAVTTFIKMLRAADWSPYERVADALNSAGT